jgi:hypothetical protein
MFVYLARDVIVYVGQILQPRLAVDDQPGTSGINQEPGQQQHTPRLDAPPPPAQQHAPSQPAHLPTNAR